MIDYSSFFEYLQQTPLKGAVESIRSRVEEVLAELCHGDFEKWHNAIKALPLVEPSEIDLNAGYAKAGIAGDIDEQTRGLLKEKLMVLHPWRKGPFSVFGTDIETEWRCDMKWDRLKDRITSLKGRTVLDVGCGNGYYCLRMAGQGAKAVVGIDPFLLYVMQFQALNKYFQCDRASVLPLKLEDFPEGLSCFDTVFSMGVLYHCREPLNHLARLYELLLPGGELVLETLTIDSDCSDELVPEGRYAKMRNVWHIPSPAMIGEWLTSVGFNDIDVIDVSKTTVQEQRKTDWMHFESLEDYLDPENSGLTIEGHPAPLRAMVVARKSR